jgi:hypothetical protein
MSGTSNVGNSQVYEAGDQRNYKDSEIQEAKKENRFHEGKENSHLAQDSSKLPCTSYNQPHLPHHAPHFVGCQVPPTNDMQRMSDPSPTSLSASRSARRRTTTS